MTGTTMTRTMKTTTDAPSHVRRRPRFGAVVAFGLVLTACSGNGAAVAPSSTTAFSSNSTAGAVQDGHSLLVAALDRYQPGYEFTSRVTIDDTTAVLVEGRSVAGAADMAIDAGDGRVEYLVVGNAQWARTPDGEWDLLSEGDGATAPLESLAAPASVRVDSASGAKVILVATYPAAAFQLDGLDLVVTLILQDGGLVSAGYVSERDGAWAAVHTDFRTLTHTTAITAPPV